MNPIAPPLIAFSWEELNLIEKEMKQIVARDSPEYQELESDTAFEIAWKIERIKGGLGCEEANEET